MKRKGWIPIPILLIVGIVLIVGGLWYYHNYKSATQRKLHTLSSTSTSPVGIATTSLSIETSTNIVNPTTTVVLLPGQTQISWSNTLQLIKDCKVTHVELYQLCNQTKADVTTKNGTTLTVSDAPSMQEMSITSANAENPSCERDVIGSIISYCYSGDYGADGSP